LLALFFNTGFLLGLLFDPKDGGNMFLWNVSWLSTMWHYIPEDRTLHNHCCEDLESYLFTQSLSHRTQNITCSCFIK
jgi:hypothetical protein